jgi:hypothetical protein
MSMVTLLVGLFVSVALFNLLIRTKNFLLKAAGILLILIFAYFYTLNDHSVQIVSTEFNQYIL